MSPTIRLLCPLIYSAAQLHNHGCHDAAELLFPITMEERELDVYTEIYDCMEYGTSSQYACSNVPNATLYDQKQIHNLFCNYIVLCINANVMQRYAACYEAV